MEKANKTYCSSGDCIKFVETPGHNQPSMEMWCSGFAVSWSLTEKISQNKMLEINWKSCAVLYNCEWRQLIPGNQQHDGMKEKYHHRSTNTIRLLRRQKMFWHVHGWDSVFVCVGVSGVVSIVWILIFLYLSTYIFNHLNALNFTIILWLIISNSLFGSNIHVTFF